MRGILVLFVGLITLLFARRFRRLDLPIGCPEKIQQINSVITFHIDVDTNSLAVYQKHPADSSDTVAGGLDDDFNYPPTNYGAPQPLSSPSVLSYDVRKSGEGAINLFRIVLTGNKVDEFSFDSPFLTFDNPGSASRGNVSCPMVRPLMNDKAFKVKVAIFYVKTAKKVTEKGIVDDLNLYTNPRRIRGLSRYRIDPQIPNHG